MLLGIASALYVLSANLLLLILLNLRSWDSLGNPYLLWVICAYGGSVPAVLAVVFGVISMYTEPDSRARTIAGIGIVLGLVVLFVVLNGGVWYVPLGPTEGN